MVEITPSEESLVEMIDEVCVAVEELQDKVAEIEDAVSIKAEKGDRGERGPKGEKGEPGAKGKDGRDGKDGRPGKDGKDGKDANIKDLEPKLEEFRTEIHSRMMDFHRGGGNVNRDITVGGNASTLSRYTDINLKAGSNVTISYANNDQTKKTDITIAATGGPGGDGIVRSISTVTESLTAGEAASTDYVLLCNAGIAVTLPTAVSNTNLYTIKNIGSSSVLVATTGGQTIDGSATILMPVQFTSIDLTSDSSNWHLT